MGLSYDPDDPGRIDEADRGIHAFVPEPGRAARLVAEARALPPGGALHGVPVGIKDIIHVDGLPTRAGSVLPPGVLAGPQATLVTRLRAAGALIAGKTVTAEFAVTAPGPTRNPRNPAHTPGGSSSGSAAAVAAGMVPLAVGTQTVGSVIRPAAYCGVVGFKPTFGRIPVDGVIANAPSFDTVGVFAPDVAGAARCAAVVCDGWRPVRSDAGHRRPPVLGIPVGPYLERAGAEALAAFKTQVERLGSAGFEVREVPVMAGFDDTVRQLFTMNRYEVARTHADWFPRHGHLYREQTTAASGRATPSATPTTCGRHVSGTASATVSSPPCRTVASICGSPPPPPGRRPWGSAAPVTPSCACPGATRAFPR